MLSNEELMAINGYSEDDLEHYGILGMKWGVRRYQNKDGSLTPAGKARYGDKYERKDNKPVAKGKNTTSSVNAVEKTESVDEMRSRLMKNPNAYEVSKNIDKFSTAELNEMANRSNAMQRLRQDQRNQQMMELAENEADIKKKLDTFANFSKTVSTGVNVIKDSAYLIKTGTYAAKIIKSLSEKNTAEAFDLLLQWADGKQQKKNPDNKKKKDDDSDSDDKPSTSDMERDMLRWASGR